MPIMRSCWLATSILAACLLAPSLAPAEEAAEDARAEALERFQRGLRLVEEEHWEEALESFEASLSLYPTAAASFNRGLCLSLSGRPADAVRALEEHLETHGERLDEAARTEAESVLETARERVGRVTVTVEDGEGAEVLLDGAAVGHAPLETPVQVNPGRHQITVRAEGRDEVDRWVTVGAGATVALEVVLPAASIELPTTGPGEGEPDPPLVQPTPEPTGRPMWMGAWVAASVAVAALGTAVGLLVWNEGRYGLWSDEDGFLREAYAQGGSAAGLGDELGERLEANEELADSIRTVDVAGWVVLGVSVAAALGAGTLFALDALGDEDTSVGLFPAPGGLSVVVGFAGP